MEKPNSWLKYLCQKLYMDFRQWRGMPVLTGQMVAKPPITQTTNRGALTRGDINLKVCNILERARLNLNTLSFVLPTNIISLIIRRTYISQSNNRQDERVWGPNSSGFFTIKSAYMSLQVLKDPTLPSNGSGN